MEQEARHLSGCDGAEVARAEFAVATSVLMGPPASAIKEATHLGDVLVLSSHERTE